MIKLKNILLENTNYANDTKSEHFSIIFGQPGVSSVAGKIMLGDINFANTYKVLPGWGEHSDKWIINRHHGAFDMNLPNKNQSFNALEELLEYLEKWYSTVKKINEDMTYKQLMSYVDDGRKERASQVSSRSLPVTTENNAESWNFRYKTNPSVTGQPFQGSIKFLKEVKSTTDAQNVPIQVDCGCPDFRFRFAYNDASENASETGPDSLNKSSGKKPTPAYDFGVGLCKHLISLNRFLQTKIKAAKKSNLFESLDEICKQPTYTIQYND